MSYIYLASPYTDPDYAIMERRYYVIEAFTAYLLCQGVHVYSPIVHCHTMAVRYDLPRDIEFWRPYNFAMLAPARELWIAMMPGWRESSGIKDERTFVTEHDIPYRAVNLPPDLIVANH